MYGLTFPVLKDNTGLYSKFGDGYIPYNVVLDKDLVVRYSASGFAENMIKLQIQNWIEQIPSSIGDNDNLSELPDKYSIIKIYPNPFNSEALVNIHILKEGIISAGIYSLTGKQMVELIPIQYQQKGEIIIPINSKGLSSGEYFLIVQYNGKLYSQKFVILK